MSEAPPVETSAISKKYWDSLEEVYVRDKAGGLSEWQNESLQLHRFLPQIAERLAGHYQFDTAIDKGGAGIVSRVIDLNLTALQDVQNEPVYRALKVARPVEDRDKSLNVAIAKEFKTLANLTHTNVIKLYYADSIKDEDLVRPFYVMDYIKDAITPRKYLQKPEVTFRHFVKILNDITAGLEFLFSRNITHNDIKPSNILIGNATAIISDLGSATKLDNSEIETTLTFTAEYAHPDKVRAAYLTRDPNRMRRKLPLRDIKVSWDLYSLGLSVLELLNTFASSGPERISSYEYRYIRLLASRLLDGCTPERAQPHYQFPKSFYEETKYRNIKEVQEDLSKITGELRLEEDIPELDFFSGRSIQVAMHGQTPTSPNILQILQHPAFKRLSSISQLGLIVYVYPGATHTRQEHSLGTFGNATRIISALWNDPVNPIFRQIMRADDLLACLLAALFHDLGQYPLAHDLEGADSSFFDHVDIGYKLLKEKIEGQDPLEDLVDRLWPASPSGALMSKKVRAILSTNTNMVAAPVRDRILHSIVDGPIDADKLDYLVRDSSKLNVPYGRMIDFERLSKVMTVIHRVQGEHLWAAIGVHEKGKVSAESVAFARYALFGSVYWHRTSRAIKGMLHRCVWEMLVQWSEEKRKSQRENFVELILRNQLPAAQQSLFQSNLNQQMKKGLWPGINAADLQMLSWLWQESSEMGKRIVEMLAMRTLYKRVLVVSKEKSKQLWDASRKFAAKASARNRLDLDNGLRDKILAHLGSLTSKDKELTRSFDDDQLARIFELDEKYPLAVVDIPGDRTGGMQDLGFFGETDRWKYSEDDLVNQRVEDSLVWAAIVENFTESLGKIRVFVHPDAKDTVRAIGGAKLEGFLITTLAERAAG